MIGTDYCTIAVRDAINELLRCNGRTLDAEVGEMYLGPDLLVVRLRRVRTVDGQCESVDRTVDLFDLMDMHVHEHD